MGKAKKETKKSGLNRRNVLKRNKIQKSNTELLKNFKKDL